MEVSLAHGEKVRWPKRVAIVGYPTYKQFEAQEIQGADANSIGEYFCFFKM